MWIRFSFGGYERGEVLRAGYSGPGINFDSMTSGVEAYPAFVDGDHERCKGTDGVGEHPRTEINMRATQPSIGMRPGPTPVRGSPGHRRPHINH